MSHRLFVALRPPPPVRERLRSVMSGIEGARWQSDAQLHLTLAFLGQLDGDKAEAVAEALHHVTAAPLDLQLDQFGTFDASRPGTTGALWIGVKPETPLAALAAAIRRTCARVGIQPDARKFVPHITLARFGGHGAFREQLAPYLRTIGPPPANWTETRFHLAESFLGHSGAHYESIASYRLGEDR